MSKKMGSCHCGKVKFEVEIDTAKGMECNCSMCGRKGTILSFAPDAQFKLISGADFLTDYYFGKKTINHSFCKVCGVTAFASGKAPDGSLVKAVNLRCIDNIDIGAIEINHFDGKNLM